MIQAVTVAHMTHIIYPLHLVQILYFMFISVIILYNMSTSQNHSQNNVAAGLAVTFDHKFMFLAQIEAAELGLVVHTLKQAGLVTLERI